MNFSRSGKKVPSFLNLVQDRNIAVFTEIMLSSYTITVFFGKFKWNRFSGFVLEIMFYC